MTDLSNLLSRVESGSVADRELDAEIATTLGGFVLEKRGRDQKSWLYHPTAPRRDGMWGAYFYTTDLNAVVALVEARLPGWGYDITYRAAWGNCTALVIGPTRDAKPHVGAATTAARALLAALIRAEMDQQP